jgi:cell division protein FtsW (lipid II flippase)
VYGSDGRVVIVIVVSKVAYSASGCNGGIIGVIAVVVVAAAYRFQLFWCEFAKSINHCKSSYHAPTACRFLAGPRPFDDQQQDVFRLLKSINAFQRRNFTPFLNYKKLQSAA